MSEQKIASQVAHAVKNLGDTPRDISIVVLKVSDKKFQELTEFYNCYIQKDLGLTEVEAGTQTAAAWLEASDRTLNYFYNLGWKEESEGVAQKRIDNNYYSGSDLVAYKTGMLDYIAGDDVDSIDTQTKAEIIKKIREQFPK